jgi:hypothetical protein
LTHALLDELDKTYPAKCIAQGESLEDAHRYAGRRALIDQLLERRLLDEKRNTAQNTKVLI